MPLLYSFNRSSWRYRRRGLGGGGDGIVGEEGRPLASCSACFYLRVSFSNLLTCLFIIFSSLSSSYSLFGFGNEHGC